MISHTWKGPSCIIFEEVRIQTETLWNGLLTPDICCAPGCNIIPLARISLSLVSVLLALLLVCPVSASDLSGHVVAILDGDTLDVLRNQRSERIRLQGIDCPEKGQAFGQKAKQATAALVFGKEVTIQTHGKDKYGRTIGDVILPDGVNVNQELVRQGWCWWYRKYVPANAVLEELETEARAARKGLWADPQPVPPWEWRKRKK